MARDRGRKPERVVHSEDTLAKVYFGLAKAGVKGQLAIDAVTEMQNEGILFREREKDSFSAERPEETEVTPNTTEELGEALAKNNRSVQSRDIYRGNV